jgi:hypothetical protein
MLVFAFAGAGNAVKPAFQGNEDGRKKSVLAVEDTRHVTAERFDEHKNDPAVN